MRPMCFIQGTYEEQMAHEQIYHSPEDQVLKWKPFLFSGVDYIGPFQIYLNKEHSHKSCKSYIYIFVCMTKIHLELALNLISNSFLKAFNRLVSRQGCCAHLTSDNKANFRDAKRKLQKMLDQTQTE